MESGFYSSIAAWTPCGPYKNEQNFTKMNMFFTKMNTFFVHFCKVGFIPSENREKIMQRTRFSKNAIGSVMQRLQKITFFQKTFRQKSKIGHFKNVQKSKFQNTFR